MHKIHHLNINTDKQNQFVDVTAAVENIVADSGVQDGTVLLFVPHTTAAITINENADPSVKADILGYLEKLIPRNHPFSHSEGNSDAHIKSSLVGPDLSVVISGGRLLLGTWQGIFFCEFDGPRSRKLIVKITADD